MHLRRTWILLVAGLQLAVQGCSRSDSNVTHGPASQPSVHSEQKPAGLSIVAWRSMHVHGAGPLAIEMGGAGEGLAASESRSGGLQQLEVEFSAPVTLKDAEAIFARSVDATVSPTDVTLARPNTLVLKFEGLSEDRCYLVSLAGAIDGLTGTAQCRIRCLEGDVNNDGRVDSADAQAVKEQVGHTLSPMTARFDLDRQGDKITLTDVLRTKARTGHTAECR